MASTEVVLESLRRFEAGDIAGTGELLDEHFTTIIPGIEPLNKPGMMALCAILKEAFSDFACNAKVIESPGDTVKVVLEPRGTHTGILRYPGITPIQPTGISIALPRHLLLYTVKNDKILKIMVEEPSCGGLLGLLSYIGVRISEEGDKIEG